MSCFFSAGVPLELFGGPWVPQGPPGTVQGRKITKFGILQCGKKNGNENVERLRVQICKQPQRLCVPMALSSPNWTPFEMDSCALAEELASP